MPQDGDDQANPLRLYTIAEACALLKVSRWTLGRAAKRLRPRIKVVRFGRLVRYSEAALTQLVEARSKTLR